MRRSWQLALGCWLPLMVCAAVDRAVDAGIEPVMRNASAHVRLLVAIPLWLAGERILRRRGADVLMRLGRDGIVGNLRGLEALALGTERFLGRRVTFVAVAVVALGLGQHLYWLRGMTHGPAAAWYAWVAFPVFAFAGLRYILRWGAWTLTLFRLSRLQLRTEATHPDGAGGLAFLTRPINAVLPLVLGATSVAAATWGAKIAGGEAKLTALRDPLGVWLAVALVVAVLPYLPLAVVLYRARWRGLREYGRLAMIYSRRFHARWIEEEPGPDLLGAGDIQSLNDLGGGYGYVRSMRILPIDMRQLIGVAVAVLLPFIPVLLIVVPLPELLAHAAKSVIGHGD